MEFSAAIKRSLTRWRSSPGRTPLTCDGAGAGALSRGSRPTVGWPGERKRVGERKERERKRKSRTLWPESLRFRVRTNSDAREEGEMCSQGVGGRLPAVAVSLNHSINSLQTMLRECPNNINPCWNTEIPLPLSSYPLSLLPRRLLPTATRSTSIPWPCTELSWRAGLTGNSNTQVWFPVSEKLTGLCF